ncbi:MAG: PorT family protein [Bacteroidales bacterium]|jgi:hypothetical protein|nr:PorT family protein [Bacteroidales bacterium]
MKKYLSALIALLFVTTLTAQGLQKNIFGIRAGINSSTMMHKPKGDTGSRIGFDFGASYQRLLSTHNPLHFETGLYLTSKGYEDYEIIGMPFHSSMVDINLIYLQVPLVLNYDFIISNDVTIQPLAGLYVAYGIGGKRETKKVANSSHSPYDMGYERFDWGLKIGIGTTFHNIYAGVGYEFGLYNKVHGGYVKSGNRSLCLILGYNF